VAISRDHEPWTSLGFYVEKPLKAEWQEYSETVVANATDDKARLHFDLGGSDAAVELQDVRLKRTDNGEVVEFRNSPKTFSVTYTFNAQGCRGGDYQIPRPADTLRILTLGDSYALGVGVRAEDTFSSRLQRSLGATRDGRPTAPIDVINCAGSGYATEQERLFYELVGEKYDPRIVLLTITQDDDMSDLQALARGYLVGAKETGQRPYDYTASMDALRKLIERTRSNGARLVVVLFDNTPAEAHVNKLREAVQNVLAGTDVTYLDLGPALLRHGNPDELFVHAPDDTNPNEIAHQIAAEEIEAVLRRDGLLEAAKTTAVPRGAR
jgi:hypothetical protein